MDPIILAFMTGLFTLSGVLLTYLLGRDKDRLAENRAQYALKLEQEKSTTALELEARRTQHEERRWILDLSNQIEFELFKKRLETYPPIFAELEKLSHHHIPSLTTELVREIADKLNQWGYGEAGLCMLPKTRDAVFALRSWCLEFAEGKISAEQLMHGPRTDLIERMRSDLSHSRSYWRPDYVSSIKEYDLNMSTILNATSQE